MAALWETLGSSGTAVRWNEEVARDGGFHRAQQCHVFDRGLFPIVRGLRVFLAHGHGGPSARGSGVASCSVLRTFHDPHPGAIGYGHTAFVIQVFQGDPYVVSIHSSFFLIDYLGAHVRPELRLGGRAGSSP